MRKSALLPLTLILSLLLCVGACRNRPEAEIGQERTPVVLVLPESHAQGRDAEVERLRAGLERETGLAFRILFARSSVEAIQLFGTHRADLGLLPLFEYLLAHQEYGVEARLQVLRDEGKPFYHGQLLVRADGGPKTLAELEGKKIAYSDPYSMSGFVLPAKLLAEARVRPVPVFAGGHAKAIEELLAGRVDAAATFVGPPLDPASRGLAVLATTEPIPNEPVFFRKDLDEGTKAKTVQALERLAAAPDGLPLLRAAEDVRGFARVDDRAYAAVPAMVQAAGHQIETLVPGGWIVWQSNRSDIAP